MRIVCLQILKNIYYIISLAYDIENNLIKYVFLGPFPCRNRIICNARNAFDWIIICILYSVVPVKSWVISMAVPKGLGGYRNKFNKGKLMKIHFSIIVLTMLNNVSN